MDEFEGITSRDIEILSKKYPEYFSRDVVRGSSTRVVGIEKRRPTGVKGQFIREWEEAFWIPGRDESEVVGRFIRKLMARGNSRQEAEDKVASWLTEVST